MLKRVRMHNNNNKPFLYSPAIMGKQSAAWWLAGGIPGSNCLAAFKPKGAASLAASYVNLASGGATWDAAPGVAPTFDTSYGWDFNSAAYEYLVIGSGAMFSAVPLSFVALFKADNVTSACSLLSVSNSVSKNLFLLLCAGDIAGDPVRAWTATGANAAASSLSGYLASAWYVGAAVYSAANNRAAFINGGDKGTEATSVTPAGLDTTMIGTVYWNTGGKVWFMNGKIGACAFYNIALSDDQVLALYNSMISL